jgi:hypothetical protein
MNVIKQEPKLFRLLLAVPGACCLQQFSLRVCAHKKKRPISKSADAGVFYKIFPKLAPELVEKS